MKSPILLITFLIFFLTACSGDGGGGNGNKNEEPGKAFNPWGGIASSLPETELEEGVRALAFSDGLGIRYDGRNALGEEEVCRQESRDGKIYEVCMNLEDDPYFVVLENQAFVWHSLMFERFATLLSCYSYAEGAQRGGVED